MDKTSVYAVLAAAGIMLVGPLSHDALALARAIDSGNPQALVRFAEQYPQSQYAKDAIRLAANQNGKGTSGNKGDGRGGATGNGGDATGNGGKNSGKGNGGYGG